MPIKHLALLSGACLWLSLSNLTQAEDLTPFGALQSASADGVIPAWEGGLAKPHIPGFKAGEFHVDPYADDTPLLVIDTANLAQYHDRLTAGQRALFAHYPGSFRMRIFPSRRSHALPDWIYAGTQRNAQQTRLTNDGNGLINLQPGIPFPRADSGLEIVWNHLLRWRGTFLNRVEVEANVFGKNARSLYQSRQEIGFATYRRTREEGRQRDDVLLYYSSFLLEPVHMAGGGVLLIDTLNQTRQPRLTWSYDQNERRVRRVPFAERDSPALLSEGLRTVDQTDIFSGTPSLYEWRLEGRVERWIPYNNYALPQAKLDRLLTPNHLNPDLVRWELHRVWKVTGRLRPGQQHVYQERTFYIDEDSWGIAIAESRNAQGELVHISLAHPINFYEIPMTLTVADVHHDLKSGSYNAKALLNGTPSPGSYDGPIPPDSYFQPAGLRQRALR